MDTTSSNSDRAWLREASLNRVNMLLRNKRDLPDEISVLCHTIDAADIDNSGLGIPEKFHLQQWVIGKESGRHCMLALLEYRRIQRHLNASDSAAEEANIGAGSKLDVTINLIGRSINLPSDLFQDSNVLFEKIFCKTPNAVLRETLTSIAAVALEKATKALSADQVNLALKQLRVESLGAGASTSESGRDENDEVENNDQSDKDESVLLRSAAEFEKKKTYALEAYRLQILTELIRIYIENANSFETPNSRGVEGKAADGEEGAAPAAITSDADLERHHVTLQEHVALPLRTIAQNLKQTATTEIEKENAVLLTYIKQLTAMRGTLEFHLKDFESSRAYMSLGLSKNASFTQIKKAYHSKAIKLHPDKRGGNKEQFQKLQVEMQVFSFFNF
jgi:hypothetical protein